MPPRDETALGLVETQGLVAAVEAADAMLKAADVRLLAAEQTDAALITVQVVGEVAAVRSAVEAGRAAAERVGKVVSVHVIARPADAVRRMQEPPAPPAADAPREAGGAAPSGSAPSGDLDALTVRELRGLARETPGFPLQGREISRAGKQELLELFRRLG